MAETTNTQTTSEGGGNQSKLKNLLEKLIDIIEYLQNEIATATGIVRKVRTITASVPYNVSPQYPYDDVDDIPPQYLGYYANIPLKKSVVLSVFEENKTLDILNEFVSRTLSYFNAEVNYEESQEEDPAELLLNNIDEAIENGIRIEMFYSPEITLQASTNEQENGENEQGNSMLDILGKLYIPYREVKIPTSVRLKKYEYEKVGGSYTSTLNSQIIHFNRTPDLNAIQNVLQGLGINTQVYNVLGIPPTILTRKKEVEKIYKLTLILPDFFSIVSLNRPAVRTYFIENLSINSIMDILHQIIVYILVSEIDDYGDLAFLSMVINPQTYTLQWLKENIGDKYKNIPIEEYISLANEIKQRIPNFYDVVMVLNKYTNLIDGDIVMQYLASKVEATDEGGGITSAIMSYLKQLVETRPPKLEYLAVSETTTYYGLENDESIGNSEWNIAFGQSDVLNQNGLETVITIRKSCSLDSKKGVIEDKSISQIRLVEKYLIIQPLGDTVLRDENGHTLYYVLYNDGTTQIVNEVELVDVVNANGDRILNYMPIRGIIDASPNEIQQLLNNVNHITQNYMLEISKTEKVYGQFNWAVINELLNNDNITNVVITYRNGRMVKSEDTQYYWRVSFSDGI